MRPLLPFSAADERLERLLYKINETKWLRDTGRYGEGRQMLRAVLDEAQQGIYAASSQNATRCCLTAY